MWRTCRSALGPPTRCGSKGVDTVIVTLGPQGVFAASSDFTGTVPAFSVQAVDTTAAGDVFNGALAVALAEHEPLNDAVRFANAAAALSVTKLGASLRRRRARRSKRCWRRSEATVPIPGGPGHRSLWILT